MGWFKLFFVVLALLLVVVLIQSMIRARRFLRRFDDSTSEAADRFQEYFAYAALRSQAESTALESDRSWDVPALERELLRALCARETSNGERQAVLACLREHAFADAVHREIFEALRDAGERNIDLVREQLPERLTRRGFPDVDFESFLAPLAPAAATVSELIRRFEEAAGAEKGQGNL